MTTLSKLPQEAIFNRWGKLLSEPTAGALNDMLRLLRERDANLAAMLNQGLNFTDNFAGALLSFTSNATPDTQDTTPHGLRRAPSYFLVLDIDKGGVVYRSAAFDETNVYTKCTVASAAVKIFVL